MWVLSYTIPKHREPLWFEELWQGEPTVDDLKRRWQAAWGFDSEPRIVSSHEVCAGGCYLTAREVKVTSPMVPHPELRSALGEHIKRIGGGVVPSWASELLATKDASWILVFRVGGIAVSHYELCSVEPTVDDLRARWKAAWGQGNDIDPQECGARTVGYGGTYVEAHRVEAVDAANPLEFIRRLGLIPPSPTPTSLTEH